MSPTEAPWAPNELFSAQSLNVHMAGAGGLGGVPPLSLLAVSMSDTCVLRGGTPKARHHGHEDRRRRLRVCGRSERSTGCPERPEDLSDEDRLEPSAEDQ